MSTVWPPTVRAANFRGQSINYGSSLIRSGMELGPDKVRRRGTTPKTRTLSLAWDDITGDEVDDWEDFYHNTLEDGTLTFEFTDPVNDATINVRVVEPVTWEMWLGNETASLRHFKGTLKLEIV